MARDYFDKEISVGDMIAYAVGSSSSVHMCHGTVQRVIEENGKCHLLVSKAGESGYAARGPFRPVQSDRNSIIRRLDRVINLSATTR